MFSLLFEVPFPLKEQKHLRIGGFEEELFRETDILQEPMIGDELNRKTRIGISHNMLTFFSPFLAMLSRSDLGTLQSPKGCDQRLVKHLLRSLYSA